MKPSPAARPSRPRPTPKAAPKRVAPVEITHPMVVEDAAFGSLLLFDSRTSKASLDDVRHGLASLPAEVVNWLRTHGYRFLATYEAASKYIPDFVQHTFHDWDANLFKKMIVLHHISLRADGVRDGTALALLDGNRGAPILGRQLDGERFDEHPSVIARYLDPESDIGWYHPEAQRILGAIEANGWRFVGVKLPKDASAGEKAAGALLRASPDMERYLHLAEDIGRLPRSIVDLLRKERVRFSVEKTIYNPAHPARLEEGDPRRVVLVSRAGTGTDGNDAIQGALLAWQELRGPKRFRRLDGALSAAPKATFKTCNYDRHKTPQEKLAAAITLSIVAPRALQAEAPAMHGYLRLLERNKWEPL